MVPASSKLETPQSQQLRAANVKTKTAEKLYNQHCRRLVQIEEKLAVARQRVRALKDTQGHKSTANKSPIFRLEDKVLALRKERESLLEKVRKLRERLRQRRRELRDLEREQKAWSVAAKRYQNAWKKWYKKRAQNPPGLTGSQLRASRALLDISKKDFSATLGIPVAALTRFEAQETGIEDLAFVKRARTVIQQAGIRLIDPGLHQSQGGPGVRLKRRSAAVSRAKKKSPSNRSEKRKRRPMSA